MVRPSKRRRHLGPSLRRLGPGVLAAVALALIFGAIVIALVRTAGPLTSDIGMALPNPAPDVR